MARHREDLGGRKQQRVNLHKPGFLIPAPDAPWIECMIVDVSDNGVCLDVGSLSVPDLFGLSFTSRGQVLRVCSLVWRRGQRVGARFISARELRQRPAPDEHAAGALKHDPDLRPHQVAIPSSPNSLPVMRLMK